MKKKVLKLFIFFIILFCFAMTLKCFAWDVDVNSTFSSGGNPSGKSGIDNGIEETEDFAMQIISNFLVIFRGVGLGIAVIILMTLGAKFVLGSVEQKAEVKKHLVVYVVGVAVLIMGALLLGLLQDFIVRNLN